MKRQLTTAALLVCAATAPVAAQSSASPVGAPRIVGGALLGAVAGGLVSGIAGANYTSRDCGNNPDTCLGASFPGFLWGAGAGMTLGAPLGAHLANRRQGKLLQSVLASSAIFAVEVLVLRSFVRDGRTQHKHAALTVVAITPIVQVITSSLIEARTKR